MGKVKQINIKSRTHYFYDDQINLKDFDARLLKVDKKTVTKRLAFITSVTRLLKNLLITRILTV